MSAVGRKVSGRPSGGKSGGKSGGPEKLRAGSVDAVWVLCPRCKQGQVRLRKRAAGLRLGDCGSCKRTFAMKPAGRDRKP